MKEGINMDLNDLVGKKIISIQYDQDSIIFKTDTRLYEFYAHGECCSISYINDLDNPEVFNDAVMLDVHSEHGDNEESTDGDYDLVIKWTFYKFKTTKGDCTLSFRNESNGYYNGSLVYSEE